MRRPLCSKQVGRNIDVSLNRVSLKNASYLPHSVWLCVAAITGLQVDDACHTFAGKNVVAGFHPMVNP